MMDVYLNRTFLSENVPKKSESRAARFSRKFKRAYGTRYDRRASRSIFYIHFCNFLIIYMIKKNLSSKYLKKEKNS